MIRYALARLLWSNWKFNNFCNRLRRRDSIIVRNFDLVFDGFPRSSNTYGAFMLQVTQQDRFKVLMHEHRPSIFYRAAQLDKPACLTLREPIDAASSWVLYTGFSIQKVIDYYIFFYEVLLPVRSRLLVLPFPVIIENFGLALRLINHRFGMTLTTKFDAQACGREAFRRIETLFTDEEGTLDPFKVPRPEESRFRRNAEVRAELHLPRYAASLERCRKLHSIYEAEYQRELDRLQLAEARSGTGSHPRSPSGLLAS